MVSLRQKHTNLVFRGDGACPPRAAGYRASGRQVPANVNHVINFHAPNGFGKILKPAPGFRGRLENVNVQKLLPGTDQLNIEKTNKLHQMAIAAVLHTLGR